MSGAGRSAALPRRSRPVRLGVAWACLLLAGTAVTVVSMAREPGTSLPALLAARPGMVVALLTALAAGGVVVWTAREGRIGSAGGMALGGTAAALPFWASTPLLPAGAIAPATAVGVLLMPGIVMLATGWRRPGVRQAGRAVGGVFVLAVVAGLVEFTAYNPIEDPGCSLRCVDREPLTGGLLANQESVLAWALVVVAACAMALRSVIGEAGRVPRWVWAPSATGVALFGVLAAARIVWWGDVTASGLLRSLAPLPVLIVALGCAVVARNVRWARRSLRGLVRHLDRPGSGAVHRLPRETTFHFARPDGGGWVDALGRPVVDDSTWRGREVTTARGDPALRVLAEARVEKRWARAGAVDPTEVWDALDWLIVDNARSAAMTLAQQREVVDSQRRIIVLADEERRRIERDLHDGAQQRLVAVKLHLAVARGEMDGSAQHELRAAEDQIQAALTRLREIAHRVFPRLLETGGLSAALEDLVDPLAGLDAVELRGESVPVPRSVALAIYSTIAAGAEAARRRRTGSISALVMYDRREVAVRMRSSRSGAGGFRPEWLGTDVTDRIAALGGQVRSLDGLVEVVIPCES